MGGPSPRRTPPRQPGMDLHDSIKVMLDHKWRQRPVTQPLPVSTDPLRRHLTELDIKLSGMYLWDGILMEMASRPALFGASSAISKLMGTLRGQLCDFTNIVQLIFNEIRQRVAFDWTLDELENKKTTIEEMTKTSLDQVKAKVDREVNKAERWESYLATIKDNIKSTIHDVSFTSPPSLPPLATPSSFRELHQALSPPEGAAPTRLTVDHVPVTTLENGSRIVATLTTGSTFFEFVVVDRQIVGLSLSLSQSPSGSATNYLQLLIGRGALPTTRQHAFQVGSRNVKHASLQLREGQLQPGRWFIKVKGIGMNLKRFALEMRLMMDPTTNMSVQNDIFNDVDNAIASQQTLTSKLGALERVSLKTAQNLLDDLTSRANNSTVGIQATPAPTFEDVELPSTSASLVICSTLGGFASMLTLPLPDPSSLHRPSLRATLRSILRFYRDQMQRATEPNEICRCVYDTFVRRMGVVKMAEKALVELANVIKRRRWNNLPRIQMFGRLCGILGWSQDEHLDHTDLSLVLSIFSTIKLIVEGPSQRVRMENIDGNVALDRHVVVEVLDTVFPNDTSMFKANIIKYATTRTNELSQGKLRTALNTIDGDALIEAIHRQWRHENHLSANHIRRLFKSVDFDESGWIAFPQFIVACSALLPVQYNHHSISPKSRTFSPLDVVEIYMNMIDGSKKSFNDEIMESPPAASIQSHRPFLINRPGFIVGCRRSALISKEYAKGRIRLPQTHEDQHDVMSSIVSQGQSITYQYWAQIRMNWKRIEQLVMNEIKVICNCKFNGYDALWSSLNRFKTELGDHDDEHELHHGGHIDAVVAAYAALLDDFIAITVASPIVMNRSAVAQ